MCKVTFIPSLNNKSFILTSNRDEKEYRSTVMPEIYKHRNLFVAYPKDVKAGGFWIAINNNDYVNCLLNGGVQAHQKQKYHTISRGIMLLELSAEAHLSNEFFKLKNLSSVEPFTIVSINQSNGTIIDFTEFIWDGKDKHFRQLEKNSLYI